ncbi:hypothetical protein [Pseudobythopirellula maris]|uniref:hypothetical protein n=1 Tax=Pseudobythopirellula maris TaxID=2527991 RepID=UPI0011B5F37F|nr:hypothetical protein [Pseudobythopirellula maris]
MIPPRPYHARQARDAQTHTARSPFEFVGVRERGAEAGLVRRHRNADSVDRFDAAGELGRECSDGRLIVENELGVADRRSG